VLGCCGATYYRTLNTLTLFETKSFDFLPGLGQSKEGITVKIFSMGKTFTQFCLEPMQWL